MAEKGNEGETTLSVFATHSVCVGIWESSGAGEAFSFSSEHVPDTLNNNLGIAAVAGKDSLVFSYTTIVRDRPTSFWAARSLDGGRTFTRSLIALAVVPIGFPMLASHRSSEQFRGRVYAVWLGRKDAERGGLDVLLSNSTAWGVTWSEPVVVNTSTVTVQEK